MTYAKNSSTKSYKRALIGLMVSALLVLAVFPAVSARKDETIETSALRTGDELGQIIGISVEIHDYSTPEDRQVLMSAFGKDQNQGLVNARTKMHAVGLISTTGTQGFDLAYIRMTPTPTGPHLRLVTKRQIRIGEAWTYARSQSFNLTAGEFDLNDTDKSKSTGILFPECQLTIDKKDQFKIELTQNAWNLWM